jgi:hypothetical protein
MASIKLMPGMVYKRHRLIESIFGVPDVSLIDLSDPATYGCLLFQARWLWGDPEGIPQDYSGYGGIEWAFCCISTRSHLPLYDWIVGEGETEMECILDAIDRAVEPTVPSFGNI